MKSVFAILFTLVAITSSAQENSQKKKITFTENKGQVCNQNNSPRPDVLFYGASEGMQFHITAQGISYQLQQVEKWREIENLKTHKLDKSPEKISLYRVDVKWLNSNSAAVVEKEGAEQGYENFYLEQCPDGALQVQSYSILNFKEIYKSIDLKWYERNGQLEYDFNLHPFADPSQIKLQVQGADKLYVNADGELVIETPFGHIIEKAPVAFQGSKSVEAKWQVNGKEVGFLIGEYNHAQTLVIDPLLRQWGTYYGGSGTDNSADVENDIFGNVYITGNTSSSGAIATTGAHLVSLAGSTNAFLAKFSSAGVRQWATYYGGAGAEVALSCCINGSSADVYMVGYTSVSSGTSVATAAAHQTVSGGGEDGFLVKFNSLGVRQWATFYGGLGNDRLMSCVNDFSGNVFVCGFSNSATGTVIATAGSHQAASGGSFDAFLVKFNGNGLRQWGTYYGGTANSEIGYACTVDGSGNFVYMTGESNNTLANVISTTGSHQITSGGGRDAFLVKFNTNGVRQWGTYYGGTGTDIGKYCAIDQSNNVIICGETTSPSSTLIATAASHQTTIGGGFDAFVVKFNSLGVRQWATYYGGAAPETAVACFTDLFSNVYLAGVTSSGIGNVISTAGSYQSVWGGSDDAYLVKFDVSGARQWGTYYGASGGDYATSACIDVTNGNNFIYLVGITTSNVGTVIASNSSHQSNYGGGIYDAFLVEFFDCTLPLEPINNTSQNNSIVCEKTGTTVLSSIGSGTLTWYSAATGGIVLGTGNSLVTPTLSAGVYSVYVEAFTCAASSTRKEITFTVTPQPTVAITSSAIAVCAGTSVTLTVAGASTYTWNTNSTSTSIAVSPSTATSYSVVGTDIYGCSNTSTFSLIVNPQPTLSLASSSSVICNGASSTLSVSGAFTYSWSTSASTSVTVVSPTITTSYSVVGIDSNGCTDSLTYSQVVSPCTNVSKLNEQNFEGFYLYPNPTSGNIWIKSERGFKVKIITIYGQEIMEYVFEKGSNMVDISTFTSGIYYFVIKDGFYESVVKVSKTR